MDVRLKVKAVVVVGLNVGKDSRSVKVLINVDPVLMM